MIIKRRYCSYGQLMNDNESKDLLLNTLKKYVPADKVEWLMEVNHEIIVHNTDMGSAIPGQAYQEILQKLEKLDIKKPFDNGLNFNDINRVLSYPNDDGSAVLQFMISQRLESPAVIAQVVAFEYDADHKMQFIEPWDIGQIIF